MKSEHLPFLSALHEAEARLEELPAVSATYEELVDLGFITSRAVDPVPPSPSDTRYVDFVISTTEDVRNGEVYYHTRIYARNDYSSTNDVGAPLYFRNTTDIISESEGTPGFVLDAAKLVLDEVIGGTPEDSIPFFTPTDLLGPSFEEDILTSLSMTTMLSYDFAYDYVASESLPIYYEMLTSERMGFDYFYEYFKRNSNGMVESDTINADDITTETEYYGNTNRAREYVFDLFDEDPFEHELHGFTSVTAELNMYIDGRRVEETYEIGTAYYRSLSSVPGA